MKIGRVMAILVIFMLIAIVTFFTKLIYLDEPLPACSRTQNLLSMIFMSILGIDMQYSFIKMSIWTFWCDKIRMRLIIGSELGSCLTIRFDIFKLE